MTDASLNGAVCVVIGGYVNGYGIIRSLAEAGSTDIHLISDSKPQARWSRHVRSFTRYSRDSGGLVEVLGEFAAPGKVVVPFPTHDEHVLDLARAGTTLSPDVFMPVNEARADMQLRKTHQHEVARALGIQVPGSVVLSERDDIGSLAALRRPMIIKPASHQSGDVPQPFRNVVVADGAAVPPRVVDALENGWTLLASEVIPGPDQNVYAYTAYRSRSGAILREWQGRKLTQHPTGFGVFATATSDRHSDLLSVGRTMVDGLDAYGIVEPEFKLDVRTGELVLMEVNIRSMMWHRVGALSGVNLPEAQMLDALNRPVPAVVQDESRVMLTYASYEIANHIRVPNYRTGEHMRLKRNAKRSWAFWSASDPLPFVASLWVLVKVVGKSCLGRLRDA